MRISIAVAPFLAVSVIVAFTCVVQEANAADAAKPRGQRTVSLYINWYLYPRTKFGVDYYIDAAVRGRFNRLMLPVGKPYPDQPHVVPEKMTEYFIEQCHKHGIKAIAWYFTKSVKDPGKFFKELLTKYKFDGVSADDGYEMVVGGAKNVVDSPENMKKCMDYARKVHSTVKAIDPKLSVGTSGGELVKHAPVGVRCIREGLLDSYEPEAYHEAKDETVNRGGCVRAWIEAVGEQNIGKIVILLCNYNWSYGRPPKPGNVILAETKSVLEAHPKVGVGLFASYRLTDDQIEALSTGQPPTGKLPDTHRREKGKVNVCFESYFGRGLVPGEWIAHTARWIDMFQAQGAVVRLTSLPVLTDELLDNADVYVGYPAYHQWTEQEMASLNRFLERGGRACVFGGLMGERSGNLFSKFGVSVKWHTDGPDPVCKPVKEHPLTAGVKQMQGPLRDPKRKLCAQMTTLAPAEPLMTARLGDTDIVGLAAWEDKKAGGRLVVLHCYPHILFDSYSPDEGNKGLSCNDHLRLAENIVQWLVRDR